MKAVNSNMDLFSLPPHRAAAAVCPAFRPCGASRAYSRYALNIILFALVKCPPD
jgi:hypothetical protein